MARSAVADYTSVEGAKYDTKVGGGGNGDLAISLTWAFFFFILSNTCNFNSTYPPPRVDYGILFQHFSILSLVQDVVLTSGCSHALDLAFSVLANPHVDNVLIPRPYFSHYECLLKYNLINVKFYDLDVGEEGGGG